MNAREEQPNERPRHKPVRFTFNDRTRSHDKIDDSLDKEFGKSLHYRRYPRCMKKR